MKVVAVIAALAAGLACGTPRAEPVDIWSGLGSSAVQAGGLAGSAHLGSAAAASMMGPVVPRDQAASSTGPRLHDVPAEAGSSTAAGFAQVIMADEVLGPDVVIPIPEPASWATLLAGLSMFLLIAWRRLRAAGG